MATEQEFTEHLLAMSEENFCKYREDLGHSFKDADRNAIITQFKHESNYPRDKWCYFFKIPSEPEKLAQANVAAAAASKRSADVASEALELSRMSARAAQESAEAAKTMARIAEESQASAKRSAWKAQISFVLTLVTAAIGIGTYILNFSKH